jgi:uncharacterized damage-inducible protein DinB
MELHRHLSRLVRFNRWANDRILAKAIPLLPEHPVFGETYGVLPDALLHVLQAQQFWLAVWLGEPADQTENPTRSGLLEAFAASQAALEKYINGLDDDALAATFTRVGREQTISAPLGDLIAHLVTHQNFHRGEIALLLTGAGASPGDIDYYDFVYEDGGRVG